MKCHKHIHLPPWLKNPQGHTKQPSPPPVFGPKQLMRAEEPNRSNEEHKTHMLKKTLACRVRPVCSIIAKKKTHMFKRIDVFSNIVSIITIKLKL
jgi:hypothetical protein